MTKAKAKAKVKRCPKCKKKDTLVDIVNKSVLLPFILGFAVL